MVTREPKELDVKKKKVRGIVLRVYFKDNFSRSMWEERNFDI